MAFIDVLYCNSSTQFFRKDPFCLPFHDLILHFHTMMAWIPKGPFISFKGNSTSPEIRIDGVEECTLTLLHEGGEWSGKSNGSICNGPSSSLLALMRSEARSAYLEVALFPTEWQEAFESTPETSWFFCDLSMMKAGKARLIPVDGKYYLGTWTSWFPQNRFTAFSCPVSTFPPCSPHFLI